MIRNEGWVCVDYRKHYTIVFSGLHERWRVWNARMGNDWRGRHILLLLAMAKFYDPVVIMRMF